MATKKPDFKRMLLQVPSSRQDYAAVKIAAELAALLGIDLVGTYVDDPSVRQMAGMPNAREFRSGSWQPLSLEQIAHEAAFVAQEAERLFIEHAALLGKRSVFNLVTEASPAGITDSNDIIVVIEPKNPMERATHQFQLLQRRAFGSTSSILFVPGAVRKSSGPIIVIASEPEDPSVGTGLAIARLIDQPMVLMPSGPPNQPWSELKAEAAGVRLSIAPVAIAHATLPIVGGRLLVMRRQQETRNLRELQMPALLVACTGFD